MDRVAAKNGKVGHIVDSVVAGEDGRVVKTLCGKDFNESSLSVDNDLEPCSACDKKFNPES